MRKCDGFVFKVAFRRSCFSWRPERVPHFPLNVWWLGINLCFEWHYEWRKEPTDDH